MKKIIAILLLFAVFPYIKADETIFNDSTVYYLDDPDYSDAIPSITIKKEITLPSGLTEAQKTAILSLLDRNSSIRMVNGLLTEKGPSYESDEMKLMTPEIQSKIAIQNNNDRGDIYNWITEEITTPISFANDVVTLCQRSYIYLGGAHGMGFSKYINYSLKENRELNLSDFVNTKKPTIKKGLQKLLTDKFNALYKGEWGDLREFRASYLLPVSDNFYITDKGIVFCYAAYEIGPYALGEPQLEIPFAKLRLLKSTQPSKASKNIKHTKKIKRGKR